MTEDDRPIVWLVQVILRQERLELALMFKLVGLASRAHLQANVQVHKQKTMTITL